jgi:hypothetical protein
MLVSDPSTSSPLSTLTASETALVSRVADAAPPISTSQASKLAVLLGGAR